MGLLDTPLAGVANTLISLLGKSLTYIEVTEGTYSAVTLKKTPTTASTTIKGSVGNFSRNEVRGTIQATDIKVLVARTDSGLPTAGPKVKDRLTIDSVTYEIIAVTPTFSGDSVALYELAVRK